MKPKRIFAALLSLALLCALLCSCQSEQGNIAQQVIADMLKAGKVDPSQMEVWGDYLGGYSFDESIGGGYVTLFLTEDEQYVEDSICWRNYPQQEDDITVRFFPMLQVLMQRFGVRGEYGDIKEWLSAQKSAAVQAWRNGSDYRSETRQFANYEVYVQYDVDYNELYCLITATINSEHMVITR